MCAIADIPDWRVLRIRAFLDSARTADLDQMAADLYLDEDELMCALQYEAARMGIAYVIYESEALH